MPWAEISPVPVIEDWIVFSMVLTDTEAFRASPPATPMPADRVEMRDPDRASEVISPAVDVTSESITRALTVLVMVFSATAALPATPPDKATVAAKDTILAA